MAEENVWVPRAGHRAGARVLPEHPGLLGREARWPVDRDRRRWAQRQEAAGRADRRPGRNLLGRYSPERVEKLPEKVRRRQPLAPSNRWKGTFWGLCNRRYTGQVHGRGVARIPSRAVSESEFFEVRIHRILGSSPKSIEDSSPIHRRLLRLSGLRSGVERTVRPHNHLKEDDKGRCQLQSCSGRS
jgi:hypothetical protein